MLSQNNIKRLCLSLTGTMQGML